MKIFLIVTIFFTGGVYPNTNHLIGNLDDDREHCDGSDYLNNPFMVYVCEHIHKKIIQKATNSQERQYTTPDSNDVDAFNSLLANYIDVDTIEIYGIEYQIDGESLNFMCDLVDAEVHHYENGTWEIINIIGKHKKDE